MATRRLAIAALAAALLTLAPLGATQALGQAQHSATAAARSAASATLTVTGTVKRIKATSLVLQEPKNRTVTVYFASDTPLTNRYGISIFQKQIKVGHKLTAIGKYQGKNAIFALVIEDMSLH